MCAQGGHFSLCKPAISEVPEFSFKGEQGVDITAFIFLKSQNPHTLFMHGHKEQELFHCRMGLDSRACVEKRNHDQNQRDRQVNEE